MVPFVPVEVYIGHVCFFFMERVVKNWNMLPMEVDIYEVCRHRPKGHGLVMVLSRAG